MRILWNVAGGAEAGLAMTAANVLKANGIEIEFTTAFDGTQNLLSRNGWPVVLVDSAAASAIDVDQDAIVRLDREFPNPGVQFLAFSEARARRNDNSDVLYSVTAQRLEYWRRHLLDRRPDALVCWQSASLSTRAPLSVAWSLGIQTLIFVNGPSLGRVTIADIDESENWSELISMNETAKNFSLDDAGRKLALDHVREITEVHGRFQPRAVRLLPGIALIKAWVLSNVRSRPSDGDTPLAEVNWQQHWQRVFWKLRLTLGLLRYDWLDASERYVYFPMQNMSDVKLTGRNPIYADQIALAEQIATSIRPGLKLYVREHPNHPGMYDNARLRALLRHKAVKLIHPYESNIELIKKAAAVVCVNSTAGWEAYVNRVPLVLLGNPFVRRSRLIFGVDNLNDLSAAIRRAVDDGPTMYREREQEWLWFIHAALTSCAPGHSFGYKEIFGSVPKQDMASNGCLVGQALLAKLRRPRLAPRRGAKASNGNGFAEGRLARAPSTLD